MRREHPNCINVLIDNQNILKKHGITFPLILSSLEKYGKATESYLTYIDDMPKSITAEQMIKLIHEEPAHAGLFMIKNTLIDSLLEQGIELQHIKNIIMPHLKGSRKTLGNLEVLINATKSLNAPNLIANISNLSMQHLAKVHIFYSTQMLQHLS